MGGTRRRERGAASLELTGMVMVVSLIIVSLLMVATPQSSRMGQTFTYWICQVVTFGQGGCTAPMSSPEEHKPEEPCEVSRDNYDLTVGGTALFIKLKDGRHLEISRLSDGTLKYTISKSGAIGATAGVGGGVTLTLDGHKYGENASADVDGGIAFQDGQTYYVKPEDEAAFNRALLEDVIKDEAIASGGPIRWLADKASGVVGANNPLPTPDETYAEGGVSLNAGAEATYIAATAEAGGSRSDMLGVKFSKDGSKTVYLNSTVEGEAGLKSFGIDPAAAKPYYPGVDLSGKLQLVSEVTFDSKGNMTGIKVTGVSSGKADITPIVFGGHSPDDYTEYDKTRIFTSTLPIKTSADQDIANSYLAATGVATLGSYVNPVVATATAANAALPAAELFAAARDRGYTTQQEYTSKDTAYGLGAGGKILAGAELGGEYTKSTLTSTSAKYWDGAQWVEWEGCNG